MNRLLLILAGLLAFLAESPALAQRAGNAIEVSLLAESATVAPGGKIELAFVMHPRSGWHGYWSNPGDAGLPARIAWTLPSGVAAGPLRYPVPDRLIIAGMMNYVYERDYALLAALTIPADIAPGTRVPIAARLDYLACTDKICVPEHATVAAQLTVAATADRAEHRGRIDRFRERLPRPLGSEARFAVQGDRLRLAVPLPRGLDVDEAYFYPTTEQAIDYAAPQSVERIGDWLIVETKAVASALPRLEGVLRIGEGQGLSLSAVPGPVPAAAATASATSGATPTGGRAVLAALAGAILGGLLLNIMPCVFPILSLKALTLARAGGEERAARREALAYSAGVILVCTALGGALLALRAGGSAAGWAFQLQDPRVILFLLLLVVVIGLNLAGLFELPALTGGGRLAAHGGIAGSFWTGALAAFVATPCTGPFMGAALGAALVLPTLAALAIFAGLGLGLALPFLLLGFVPPLRRLLPRPGPWLGRFRRLLAIPMLLTAAALAWVLDRQAGLGGLAFGLAAAVAVALALWWAGRRHGWAALAPGALLVAVAVASLPAASTPAEARARGALDARPFSEARLAALRAEGRPVFVYFTADWCVTCKVNEQAVLERDEVARVFRSRNVAVLVGDWTRGDAEIGRFLEAQGRSGVPLYLWYPPGKPPRALPQILTVAAVTGLPS